MLHATLQHAARHAPWLIVVGVLMLVGSMAGMQFPVLSAVALMALGATLVLAQRTGGDRLVTAAQTALYCGLYAMFVGAMFHPGSQAAIAGPALLIDLTVSLAIMACHVPLLWRASYPG